jgi:hypothetical protein
MKHGAVRTIRENDRENTDSSASDFAGEMRALLASADADQLSELRTRANAALPDDDPRKIHADDVRMLRRLAGQARTFSASLLEHAAERRLVGERRGRVSPEAGDTARWAERLSAALEALTSRRTATTRARR